MGPVGLIFIGPREIASIRSGCTRRRYYRLLKGRDRINGVKYVFFDGKDCIFIFYGHKKYTNSGDLPQDSPQLKRGLNFDSPCNLLCHILHISP